MSRYHAKQRPDDNDDPQDEEESVIEEDAGSMDEDVDETDPCPKCNAPVYTDGEWCPKCGYYFTKEEGASTQKTWIVVVAGVLLGVMMLLAVLGR